MDENIATYATTNNANKTVVIKIVMAVVNLHANEIQLYDKLRVGHHFIIVVFVTEHIPVSYVPAEMGPDVASLVITL